MVKIRLERRGAKKNPFYRIVVISDTKKRGGKPIQIVGYWNPKKNEKKIDRDRLNHWLKLGAQITPAVKNIISK